jgi:hypothetical protein
MLLIQDHRFLRVMLNMLSLLFPFKVLLTPSHAALKYLTSLDQYSPCPPFPSKLNDRTNMSDLDTPA